MTGKRWEWLVACGLLTLTACESKKETADGNKQEEEKKPQVTVQDAEEQCGSLGNSCGREDKFKTTIATECKAPLKDQFAAGCGEQVLALLKCLEKEICPGKEAVQVYDDFRVLTARHKKCTGEQEAVSTCTSKNAGGTEKKEEAGE